MPAAIPAIIAAGSAVYGASQQRRAASQAANAQERASQQAIEEQRRMYSQTEENLSPYMDAGRANLAQLMQLNSGDYSSFQESPDYQFTLSEGIKGLDRSAAARGRLYSGGYGEDLTRFGQGLASQQYNNYYNKLWNLANMGRDTASDLGRFGAAMAGANGQALLGAGQARAGAYQQIGNANAQLGGALGNAANQIGGYYNWWQSPQTTGSNGTWNGQPLPGQTFGGYPQWGSLGLGGGNGIWGGG